MVEAKKQIEGMKKAYLSWSLRDHDAREIARIEGRQEGRNEGLIEGRMEGIAIGEKRGRSEGATEKARDAARNMLAMNLGSLEQIAQAVGLSVAEVEQLAAQG